MTIRIRAAGDGDVETLSGFAAAMAAETEDKPLDVNRVRQGLQSLLRNGQGRVWVAEADQDDGRWVIVGSVLATWEWTEWRNGRFWWIQSVFVDPDWRRRGVYSTLHSYVRERARSDPLSVGLRLYVEQANTGAQATYRHLGMVETHYRIYEEEF